MKIQLNNNAIDWLRRSVRGSGGFQSLLRRMQTGLDHAAGEMEILESDMEKWIRYSVEYGQGGSKIDLNLSLNAQNPAVSGVAKCVADRLLVKCPRRTTLSITAAQAKQFRCSLSHNKPA